MAMGLCSSILAGAKAGSTRRKSVFTAVRTNPTPHLALALLLLASVLAASAQTPLPSGAAGIPPAVRAARRFLAHRGMVPGSLGRRPASRPGLGPNSSRPRPQGASPARILPQNWEPLGPAAVLTSAYGLVSGRITSLALDPSDATGNTLYAGTTGGGVWVSHNAATSNVANVVFTPLTDRPSAVNLADAASISIGAVTVQPGGTGVVFAGTGDPNDALDSWYGAGLLRSADGGSTWTLILGTSDVIDGISSYDHGFIGEGFAGFAWSTLSPAVVVAAVSQSVDSARVAAGLPGYSYSGLYYSTDSGASWHLSKITDGDGKVVQDSSDAFAGLEGNAATAVVWNPVRKVFLAAVRFHGYYQSPDGVTWTRLDNQPGAGLTAAMCPTNHSETGSPACPIFRAALAVNPLTGDTFAWTVDLNNQDQGLWQDACTLTAGACAQAGISFSTQLGTTALETATLHGTATILNGDYNLALAAVPSDQDTLLLAGANDLWKCSLAAGCSWRNTTNSTTCMSAQVGEYQHALAWNPANPQEILEGNDSGLWRSEDAIGETGAACSPGDSAHWQNLNGSLGSLAEVESMSQVVASSYTLMTGLGANGSAGVRSTTAPTSHWPQILAGEGGPVAVDLANPDRWYVNNGAGVSIHLCSSSSLCKPSDFGELPVVSNADVANDGLTMIEPAPFLVDPADSSQLLVATCRLWRGPASPNSWTSANAVTPMLGKGTSGSYCSGNPLVRSLAAAPLPGGGEVVYAGTFSSAFGGANLAGHVLNAAMDAGGTWSDWNDLTLNPVVNDALQFNPFSLDVSAITIDPHDTTGNTVYASITGISADARLVYRSTDGGAHWTNVTSNLQHAPANSLVVDPVDANTVYIATDAGVSATQQIATCGDPGVNCWFALGAGLPESPVIALSAAPTSASPSVLVAGTYGRGVWQIPLLTAGIQMTTATASPASLTFDAQAQGTTSNPQAVTLTNTSSITLLPTVITAAGDFAETDNCAGSSIDANARCTIQVTFSPTRTGTRTGKLTIQGNISTGNISLDLTGTGVEPAVVNLQPTSIDFGNVEAGTVSPARQITAENAGGVRVDIASVTISGPFVLASNSCGSTSLAPNADCSMTVEFDPSAAGSATGTLTMVDSAGTQTVQLSGAGTAPPTDALSPASLAFGATIIAVTSPAQAVTLTNSGGNPLTSIAVSVTAPFQQSNNCTTQLAAGAACSISVTYLPTAAGAQTGTLTVADILKTQTVPLSGTGLLPPAFSASPTSLDFGVQQVNVASAPLTLTLTNSGGASLANVGFQITGPSAATFANGASTCGAKLDSGASCTLQVIFTPAASGTAQATLTVTSSTSQVKPLKVPLSGTGQSAAGLTATPTQLTFAAIGVGQTSPAQTVTIANSGQTSAAGLTLAASGPFSLTQNTCGSTLASGASCTAGVVFTPAQTGNLSGALTVSSSSVSPPATVALSGIGGLAGALAMQPSQINFPTTGVGTVSSAVAVTLSNTSTSVALDQFVLAASAGFRITSTTCGSSLPANSSCTANVAFAPTSAGAATGTLAIASAELAANATVALSGTGFDFTPATSGSASQTVSSGQTASYTLTLSPVDGAAGTFTFQCNSLPKYAACVFSPSILSVLANSTGTESVDITTSQTSAALQPPGNGQMSLTITLACGLLLLPLALRRRRAALVLVLLLAVAVAGVTGCSASGGGGGATPPPPTTHTTAPGTYSIPVVISSGGVQHTFQLTLVVD